MGKILKGIGNVLEQVNPFDGDGAVGGFFGKIPLVGNITKGVGKAVGFTQNTSENAVKNSFLLKTGSLVGGGILGGKLGKNLGGPLGGVIGLAGGALVMRKIAPELAADVAGASDYGAQSGKGFKLKALAANLLNFSGQTYDGKKGEAEKD